MDKVDPMKINLKEFQKKRLNELYHNVKIAKDTYKKYDKRHAITFSAPTGSGKTVVLAAYLEKMLIDDPRGRYLWISDQPQLNLQSLEQLKNISDIPHNKLRLITHETFYDDTLPEGEVCFINTQKLTKNSKLVKRADNRKTTMWECISNTINSDQNFYVIIDEAHRGLKGVANGGRTIIRKFLDGDEQIKLPPCPIIIGISATPDHFDNHLKMTNDRSLIKITVTTKEARESGLLKKHIIVSGKKNDENVTNTLFKKACCSFNDVQKYWEPYGIRPIFVIQVKDGSTKNISKTNLNEVLNNIHDYIPNSKRHNSIIHCFENRKELNIHGHMIYYEEPHKIEHNENVQIVLFKTALNTGWDCPRAEIMFSYRISKDHTTIKQLVGRMLRTPKKRHVEGNNANHLNDCHLYLPYYDPVALKGIIMTLNDDPTFSTMAVDQTEYITYFLNQKIIRPIYEKIPTYVYEETNVKNNIDRLLDFATNIKSREKILDVFYNESRHYLKQNISDDELQMPEVQIITQKHEVLGESVEQSTYSTPQNLKDFSLDYLDSKKKINKTVAEHIFDKLPDDWDYKEQAICCLARNSEYLKIIDDIAKKQFDELWSNHSLQLKEKDEAKYHELARSGNVPTQSSPNLPNEIQIIKTGKNSENHLYTDTSKKFHVKLNNWELSSLERETNLNGFYTWIRNIRGQKYSISIPYDINNKLHYPDFITFHKINNNIMPSLIEPHNDKYVDFNTKIIGMAKYATNHADVFHRIEMQKIDENKIGVIDLMKPNKRNSVMAGTDMDALYDWNEIS